MTGLKAKHFAYYTLLGSGIHFWYGIFDHFYYQPPGESLLARLPIIILLICFSVSIFVFKLKTEKAEMLFYAGIAVVTLHYLYLIETTPHQVDYFNGLSILLIACSLMIFNKKFLLLYFLAFIPLSAWVGFRIESEAKMMLRIMNLEFSSFFLLLGNILKIDLIRNLAEAREHSQQARDQLRKRYKKNLQAAHDLGSPVSTIGVVASKIKSENEKWYNLLKSSSDQILNISSDLMTDHLMTKDQSDIDFFDLEQSLSKLVHDKSLEFGNIPNLSIDLQFTRPVANHLDIPESEFKRVISNIINNSVQAMTNNNRKVIYLLVSPNSRHVCLSISDNGCGIDKQKVARIFDENVSFKRNGMGLGLSFAKEKINSWGGSIAVESTSSKGTTIKIDLPY